MSRPVRSNRRSHAPTMAFVAAPLILVALAIGFAMARPKPDATMPPPEPAAVPHFIEEYERQL